MGKNWFEKSYRRNLIDMHIPDWDERFLSEFDPATYVDMLKISDVDTAIIYSSSCLGNCYWPTKAGHMHNGLKGRDILGETIAECHRRGIENVVVYFNIWSRWAYKNHPDWRMVNVNGLGTLEYLWTPGRYGVCCHNSPYRDFVKAQIEDLCSNYEFKGLWIDMIGWISVVCYCSHCRRRYFEETGHELPKVVNWEDPKWVLFQKKRGEWFAEFAAMITDTAKGMKPGISVVHQCASLFSGWRGAPTQRFFDQNDYLAGDFYMGAVEQSFVCKFLNSLTKNTPIEFMTSRCPDLTDHTTIKSRELLKEQAYSALANNGSFLFIDAIDPVGTLNRDMYEEMGSIFREIGSYEKYMDSNAQPCSDVAVYMNFESMITLKDNGKNVEDASKETDLFKSAYNITKTLLHSHIPFGVITGKNLGELRRYQVVILPNLVMLDEEEVKAFKEYVSDGGSIYASKNTSVLTKDGVRKGNFLLSELFGASFVEETKESVTYMAPTGKHPDIFGGYSAKYPVMIPGTQVRVKAGVNAEILATLTLPYTDPADTEFFSSAISNPPGIPTESPAVLLNRYGKGKVVYAAGEIEKIEHEPHRDIFVNLIKMLAARSFVFETDAPKPVEVILLNQVEKKRYIINLLNCQSELPNIPVEGIRVRVLLDGKQPVRLLNLPGEEEIHFAVDGNYLEFTAPKIDIFLMIALDYK